MRAGVLFPTLIFKVPLYFLGNLSFGKVAVQSDPWFGQPEESIGRTKVHQLNLGLRVAAAKYVIGYTYSFSDLDYIGNYQLLSFGVNFR